MRPDAGDNKQRNDRSRRHPGLDAGGRPTSPQSRAIRRRWRPSPYDPRRLTEAAALNVPLVLSGHTHGGQVVIPGVGAIAAQKFPVVAGIGRRDRTTMFVSRGVGTVYVPVRINCPPEVAVLTLQASVL